MEQLDTVGLSGSGDVPAIPLWQTTEALVRLQVSTRIGVTLDALDMIRDLIWREITRVVGW